MQRTVRTVTASLLCLAWPVAAASAEPWSTPASWEVKQSDVRFESEGVELSGTLFSPRGATAGPAVVAVQQNGTTTRDNVLFLQLAETFPAIGYSVFSYDRRDGEDIDIPVQETLEIIADGAGDRNNLHVVVIPGADHLMRVPDEPLVGEEANRARLVSESVEYFLVMGHWLGNLERSE